MENVCVILEAVVVVVQVQTLLCLYLTRYVDFIYPALRLRNCKFVIRRSRLHNLYSPPGQCAESHAHRYRLPDVLDLIPTFAIPLPGNFHPNQPVTIFFANISPKPSITPLTNGSTRFIAKLEIKAPSLVCMDRFESNIASDVEVATGATFGEGRVACGLVWCAWWGVG